MRHFFFCFFALSLNFSPVLATDDDPENPPQVPVVVAQQEDPDDSDGVALQRYSAAAFAFGYFPIYIAQLVYSQQLRNIPNQQAYDLARLIASQIYAAEAIGLAGPMAVAVFVDGRRPIPWLNLLAMLSSAGAAAWLGAVLALDRNACIPDPAAPSVCPTYEAIFPPAIAAIAWSGVTFVGSSLVFLVLVWK